MKYNIFIITLLLSLNLFVTSCNKNESDVETSITDVTVKAQGNSATVSCKITFQGEKEIALELGRSADLSDSRFYGMEIDTNNYYSVTIYNLIPNVKYYYRVEVSDALSLKTTDIMEFVTFTYASSTLAVIAINANNIVFRGNVTTPSNSEVTECGVCWSISPEPTIQGSHVSAGIWNGSFKANATGLTRNTSYYFRAYVINDAGVSYSDELLVRTLVSPTGAIGATFSVSDSQSVWFSMGNLQCLNSYGYSTWRFAEKQYDYIGNANSNISQNYNDWIDLFGWGTSGRKHGAICYQSWSTSTNNEDYCAYGMPNYSLNDSTGKADWGSNIIENGGASFNLWRTLTESEWNYVLNGRETPTDIRYAKAVVNNKKGLLLLPDNWYGLFSLNNCNEPDVDYSNNVISVEDWSVLESSGVVFLPAAGYRKDGTLIILSGNFGEYWSASAYKYDTNKAEHMSFSSNSIYPSLMNDRHEGLSVRLVRDAE